MLEGSQDNKQASWRTDPSKSGIAGGMGDIGTHAFNLGRIYIGTKSNTHVQLICILLWKAESLMTMARFY
ncbi:MAG: hypothetical protein WKG06_46755 [Segetibacter sp.]